VKSLQKYQFVQNYVISSVFFIYRDIVWNVMFWSIQSVWMEARAHHYQQTESRSRKQKANGRMKETVKSLQQYQFVQNYVLSSVFFVYRDIVWNCDVLKHTVCLNGSRSTSSANRKQQTANKWKKNEGNSEVINSFKIMFFHQFSSFTVILCDIVWNVMFW